MLLQTLLQFHPTGISLFESETVYS